MRNVPTGPPLPVYEMMTRDEVVTSVVVTSNDAGKHRSCEPIAKPLAMEEPLRGLHGR